MPLSKMSHFGGTLLSTASEALKLREIGCAVVRGKLWKRDCYKSHQSWIERMKSQTLLAAFMKSISVAAGAAAAKVEDRKLEKTPIRFRQSTKCTLSVFRWITFIPEPQVGRAISTPVFTESGLWYPRCLRRMMPVASDNKVSKYVS